MYNRFPSLISPKTAVSYDSDAQAYFTAAGITSTTEKNAWNTFVLSAKSGGYAYWANMITLYPFLGGTETSSSYNAKNTSLYQISWDGGVTIDSTGVTGNGSNANGDTYFDPVTGGWTNSSACHGGYFRTGGNDNKLIFGDINFRSCFYNLNGKVYSGFANNNYLNLSSYTYSKLIIANVNSSNVQKVYKDGTEIGSNTGSIIIYDGNLYLLGINSYYSTVNLGFYFISGGLSTDQITKLNTDVNTLMTALGRNV